MPQSTGRSIFGPNSRASHCLAPAGLSGWNTAAKNLRYGDFSGNLSGADFRFSWLDNADFQGANLANANLYDSRLRNANLTGANLANANLSSTLTNANLTGAVVTGTQFNDTTRRGFTATQLYSTQSYAAKDLHGIGLWGNNLTGWDFSGQKLTNAYLSSSTLTNANLTGVNLADAYLYQSTLTNANLTGTDTRGAKEAILTGAILKNTILPDGQLNGLNLGAGENFLIRDEDGVPDPPTQWWLQRRPPIPVTIQSQLKMADGGVLQLLFEADPWDSKISFRPGIPVQVGGTLELTFTDDVMLATQSGRTLQVFDWRGVTPQGQFTVAPQLGTAWDLNQLYTKGEVTLLGISSDLDADKDVDSHDLSSFIGNWTGTDYPAQDKTWRHGDADFDGDVDSNDLLTFLEQWTGVAAERGNVPTLVSQTAAAVVPEPTGVLWLVVASISLLLSST